MPTHKKYSACEILKLFGFTPIKIRAFCVVAYLCHPNKIWRKRQQIVNLFYKEDWKQFFEVVSKEIQYHHTQTTVSVETCHMKALKAIRQVSDPTWNRVPKVIDNIKPQISAPSTHPTVVSDPNVINNHR
eukprot:UN04869